MLFKEGKNLNTIKKELLLKYNNLTNAGAILDIHQSTLYSIFKGTHCSIDAHQIISRDLGYEWDDYYSSMLTIYKDGEFSKTTTQKNLLEKINDERI